MPGHHDAQEVFAVVRYHAQTIMRLCDRIIETGESEPIQAINIGRHVQRLGEVSKTLRQTLEKRHG